MNGVADWLEMCVSEMRRLGINDLQAYGIRDIETMMVFFKGSTLN